MEHSSSDTNLKIFPEHYYTSFDHLSEYYDHHARKMDYHAENPQEHTLWKNSVRSKLIELIGFNRMQKCDGAVRLLETTLCDGYRREKRLLQTEPDVWMPFYMLIPQNISSEEKLPCIIAPHGHVCYGKEGVAGTIMPSEQQNLAEIEHTAYGAALAKQGYIVFCPDARGSGERRELREQGIEKANQSSCNGLNFAAMSLGMTLTGMWIWDLCRLIDYIETVPLCDAKNIGCCGFSGGGMQSLWLTAMEDRITCAVVSGYFHSYKGTMLRTNQCGCNFVPHLWEYVDIGDIGALIAPRPLLIETGSSDPLNGSRGLEDVKEQVAITQSAYRLLNAQTQLTHCVYEGGHQWYGKAVNEFFAAAFCRNK